jgi:hypothetical protein
MPTTKHASPLRIAALLKLRRMLIMTARHNATHALLLALVAIQLVQGVTRLIRKRRAQERFLAQLEQRPPLSRVQSAADLASLEKLRPPRAVTPPPGLAPRSLASPESVRTIATMLKSKPRRSSSRTSLCDECFSRCSSHTSLVSLEQALSEAAPQCGECDDAGCVVCAEEEASWRVAVRRTALAGSGSLLAYCIWLRLLAPRATVVRHMAALMRFVGQSLFGYRVENLAAIPKDAACVVYAYIQRESNPQSRGLAHLICSAGRLQFAPVQVPWFRAV